LGDDFDRLMAEAEKWAKEPARAIDTVRRQLLCDWVYIARWTGLRVPHEAELLRWSDIRLDINMLFVSQDTKTGKREVPFEPHVAARFAILKQRQRQLAAADGFTFAENWPVFALPDGTAFRNFGGLFNEVVALCAFAPRQDEMPYSPYSLRHTYATFALAAGKDYAWLEEVMGTSEKMLKTHYKSGTIEQSRRYLESKGLLWGIRDTDKPLGLISETALAADDSRRRPLILGMVPAVAGTGV
ncbi:MAG: tyrosine-type recombinase/integrase, partial [Rhodospirillaceae bacterium]